MSDSPEAKQETRKEEAARIRRRWITLGELLAVAAVLISALTTKYRDLRFLVSFGVSLLMYATPVIYPASAVPARFQLFIQLNPVTSLIETFRYGFLGSGTVNPWGLLYSFVFMLVTVVLGAVVFNRVEATFMDTV